MDEPIIINITYQERKKIYAKEYYSKQENKDKHKIHMLEPIRCDVCGCTHAKCKEKSHQRTPKHLKNLQIQILLKENQELKNKN